MPQTFSGQVDIQDGTAKTTIRLDGNNGDLSVGGGGQGGEIKMQTSAGTQRINLNGDPGIITFVKPAGMPTITLDGGKADISAGGGGEDGDLTLKGGIDDLRIRLDAGGGAQTTERIYLDGAAAEITVGGNVNAGTLKLKAATGEERVRLQGSYGSGQFGGNGADGIINILPKGGSSASDAAIVLSADNSEISFRSGGNVRTFINGKNGDLVLGGHGVNGNIVMHPSSVNAVASWTGATILLDAGDSSVSVRSDTGKDRIRLDGKVGDIFAGGNGVNGELKLYRSNAVDSSAKPAIHLDAGGGNIWLGGNGVDGDLVIFPSTATNNSSTAEATIHLNGDAGDIILKNADCAEEFDVTSAALDAGTVMVLDGEGALRESTEAYDKKVAGVLSGAGEYRPGIVLDRQASQENRRPLALVGKVYCKVDADCAAVEVGDLLTTSPTPGHAMKAADPSQAFGAVIGKALRPLKAGRGLIPILVALQ
ncbi:MAG TPA: hypothetical protein VJ866_13065 [Pyrinomonadaceae bacterium]|nr:hypothetical protein [Pyrinomonadaceae bacterium]